MQQPWLLLLGVLSGPDDTEQPSSGVQQGGRQVISSSLLGTGCEGEMYSKPHWEV